jgi:hypothetical protein
MAALFNAPNYLFTWKDVKTYLIRSQYNELLNFVTQEFFKNQYKTTLLPPFLDPNKTLSLNNFDEACKCGESALKNTAYAYGKDRIAETEATVKRMEAAAQAAQLELSKSWKVFEFARTDKGINETTELTALREAIIASSADLKTKLDAAKATFKTALALVALQFSDLETKATEFNAAQSALEDAKNKALFAKNEYSKMLLKAEFEYESALNTLNKASEVYKSKPDPITLQAKAAAEILVAEKKAALWAVQGKSSATNDTCRDTENMDFCLPKFKYIRKKSIPDERLINKNFQLDFTTNGVTVGSALWLYYYERMGIFKILGVLMDDYNYKGKYTISGSRKDESGNAIAYSTLMDMICTLHRLGISSNLRDRICTYQRTLGVSINNNLGIESERNQGFMQNFNKLLDNMLEYYKSKQLAVAINTGNQPRSSVATQTSILDSIRLLQQQFEAFQYGRNATNTFLGIATVQATLCLLNMLRTEIGVPTQYEKPEEFVPAAYRILVEKQSLTTPNDANRFIIYDNCASYGLRLLTDLETADINQLTAIGTGATLDLWLDDVEGWVEGYRNAYASVPEGVEAIL